MTISNIDQIEKLYEKLVADLPYDDENTVVAQAVKEFLLEHPDRISDFDAIVEDEEMETA
jgi:hypothetical protein